ncbi:MAG TPA: SDR family NAD(P)-dependent oxidoreductase [Steroidobacteraceae bacterium]|nr:SDR family NAD(P)-dependent oxidoreductase [Steroidobacteraceae bacterium]
MKRRTMLIGGGALAVAGFAGYRVMTARRAMQSTAVIDTVPSGGFGADSTAEQVTDGLDLTGKTALVTGSTSGLGLETMRVLAMRGAHVIGTGRSKDKAAAAMQGMTGKLTPVALDLTDFDSVVACAEDVHATVGSLDMLICNAGIMALPELEQVYGLEKQFVTNHLGHFLLVNRLLPQVMSAEQGRVVMVSSLGYRWAPEAGIEFDNLSGERDYEPNKMYGQSKLANGLFSLELARRLKAAGSPATANSVHPGVINTNLSRHFAKWKQVAGSLIGWTFMKSVEEGAATTVYVATYPKLAEVSGYYFEDCNAVKPTGRMEDQALAAQLWAKSEELTEKYLA